MVTGAWLKFLGRPLPGVDVLSPEASSLLVEFRLEEVSPPAFPIDSLPDPDVV